MKKIIFFLLGVYLLASCTTVRTSYPPENYVRLEMGMSKYDVSRLIGAPCRYVDTEYTRYGFLEVLEYRDTYNELLYLEFIDNHLVDVQVYQNAWHPMFPYEWYYRSGNYHRPFPPHSRPDYRPEYPWDDNRPGSTNRPPSTTRPPANANRPGSSTARPPASNSERPGSSTRPDRPASTTRPSTTTERPATSTRPATNTERPASTTTRSSPSSSTTRSESTTPTRR